jgi:hypothetical protein
LASIRDYLTSDEAWEPLASNMRRATALFGHAPRIQFNRDTTRSGSTQFEVIDGKLVPVLILTPEEDPLETLITLNHEMTHAVSLASRQRHLGDAKKLSDCLTRYQLLTLEDEAPAFRSELQFWQKAPQSFRDHFRGRAFASRLIGSTGDYDAYYKTLQSMMNRDPNAILRRYVQLGQAPACALKLLRRAGRH